ncbi:hypothetical protein D3C78_1375200 [compost metagenome]
MQQVEVQAVGAQPSQAALAGRRDAQAAGVVRVDLADQEDLVAQAVDGIAHHILGAAFAVHFRRVDQRQPALDAFAQGGHLALARQAVLAHPPGALANGGYAGAIGEYDFIHCQLLRSAQCQGS